jgi:hypothetical protein
MITNYRYSAFRLIRKRVRRGLVAVAATQFLGTVLLSGLAANQMRLAVSAIDSNSPQVVSSRLTGTATYLRTASQIGGLPPMGVARMLPIVGDDIQSGFDTVDRGTAAFRILSALFGDGDAARWLVGLQNPAEMRATGGLIGSWLSLTTGEGMPKLDEVDRIRSLASPTAAVEVTANRTSDLTENLFRMFGSTARVQNINVVPDFPTVAKELVRAYERNIERGTSTTSRSKNTARPTDSPSGVIVLDTAALALLLDLTGPLTVPGIVGEVTTTNVERIVLVDLYQTYESESDRVEVLHRLVRTIWSALFEGGLSLSPGILRQVFDAIDEGHVQIWSSTPSVQTDIERLGAAGAWPQPSGLAVGIVEQNIAANKIDQMLERSYEIETVRSPGDGDTNNAKVHVSIDFVNHAPAGGLPTYVLGPYDGADPASGRR